MEKSFYDQGYGNDIDSEFADNRLKKTKSVIRGIIRNNKIRRCLDIGCGTGYFSGFVKGLDPKIECVGIDISKKAIGIARRNNPDAEFIEADFSAWADAGNKFDLILSLESIEHIYDLDGYLAAIKASLAEGGTLVISTPNLNSWLNRILILFGMIPYFQEYFFHDNVPIFSIGKRDFPARSSVPSGHIRILNSRVLAFIAKKCDWEIKRKYGAGLYANKPIFGKIDRIFSIFPSLASCIIYVYGAKRKK